MAKVGDKFILHSVNGMDYNIEVVNVNDFREPSMKYGIDVYDGNGTYAGDILFVDDDFLNKCEKVNLSGEIVKVIRQSKHLLECCNEYKDFHVYAKWDGCCNIYRYHNGYTYEDRDNPEADVDYIHICDLREFIKFLTEIADKAEQIEGFEGYEKSN